MARLWEPAFPSNVLRSVHAMTLGHSQAPHPVENLTANSGFHPLALQSSGSDHRADDGLVKYIGDKLRLGVSGGSSIPLGATTENPDPLAAQSVEHEHMQIGSGTFDPMIALWGSWTRGSWGLFGRLDTKLPVYESAEGYRGSTQVDLALGPGYRFGDRLLTFAQIGLSSYALAEAHLIGVGYGLFQETWQFSAYSSIGARLIGTEPAGAAFDSFETSIKLGADFTFGRYGASLQVLPLPQLSTILSAGVAL